MFYQLSLKIQGAQRSSLRPVNTNDYYINIAPPKTNMTKWKLAIFLIGDVELHFFVFLCIVMLRSFQGVVLLTSVNAKGDA